MVDGATVLITAEVLELRRNSSDELLPKRMSSKSLRSVDSSEPRALIGFSGKGLRGPLDCLLLGFRESSNADTVAMTVRNSDRELFS